MANVLTVRHGQIMGEVRSQLICCDGVLWHFDCGAIAMGILIQNSQHHPK